MSPVATSTRSLPASMSVSSSSTPSCVTVTPGPNGYVPAAACNSIWNYPPSFPAAVLFCVLFGITFMGHMVQALVFRKLQLSWTMIMGCSWELAAYIIRALGTRHQQILVYDLLSLLLALTAPLWMNAFIYMAFARMVRLYLRPDDMVCRIRAKWISKIFVGCDILTFLVQAAGGSMIQPSAGNGVTMDGIHIYMGGIGMQQLSMFVFLILIIRFHSRIASPIDPDMVELSRPGRRWKHVVIAMYVALALITIRNIYRLLEFALGVSPDESNPIPFHEWYGYVFDATPIFFATVILNGVHPGVQALRGPEGEWPKGPTREEKREAKRQKKHQQRAEKQAKKEKKVAMKEARQQDHLS